MRDFNTLKVWQKAHQMVLSIYLVSKSFPKEESYGLTSQLRRASFSIPANVAEGCGRGGAKEFVYFLRIALGSASETEYYLILAHDLNYLDVKAYSILNAQVTEVKRMLAGFIQKLNADG
jgi:four helix bundle protein